MGGAFMGWLLDVGEGSGRGRRGLEIGLDIRIDVRGGGVGVLMWNPRELRIMSIRHRKIRHVSLVLQWHLFIIVLSSSFSTLAGCPRWIELLLSRTGLIDNVSTDADNLHSRLINPLQTYPSAAPEATCTYLTMMSQAHKLQLEEIPADKLDRIDRIKITESLPSSYMKPVRTS